MSPKNDKENLIESLSLEYFFSMQKEIGKISSSVHSLEDNFSNLLEKLNFLDSKLENKVENILKSESETYKRIFSEIEDINRKIISLEFHKENIKGMTTATKAILSIAISIIITIVTVLTNLILKHI